MTNILALDTTSKHASISIARKEEITFEYNFTPGNFLSASLIPNIDFLLQNSGLKLGNIDVFGIAVGPGLFTGIRVGLSALKGMIFPAEKPVVPVLTLKALAYKYLDAAGDSMVISLIDARRDEVYMAGYSISGQKMGEVIAPCLIHIKEIKKKLTAFKNMGFRFVGSGADVHEDLIAEQFKQGKVFPRSAFLAPEICKITYHEYSAGNYIKSLDQLMPFYIRKPDAEQNYRVKKKESEDQNHNKKS